MQMNVNKGRGYIYNLKYQVVFCVGKVSHAHFIGKIEPLASKFFGLELCANKKCTQCGLCVLECPAKNIQMKDTRKLKFGIKCMMCMRCIYNCPTKAIEPRISKFIPIKNGYSIKKYLSEEV